MHDFSDGKDKTALTPHAIPSVFEKKEFVVDFLDETDNMENQIVGDGIIDDAIHANNQCVQCPSLIQKVANLKKEMFKLNVQHDIEMKKLQRQIDLLENKNEQKMDQVKQFRKELSQEKKQNIRLKDVITELKDRNFISTEDEKILNV